MKHMRVGQNNSYVVTGPTCIREVDELSPNWSAAEIANAVGIKFLLANPILGTTITIDRLKKRGYVSLAEMYNLMVQKLANSNSLLTNVDFQFPMV